MKVLDMRNVNWGNGQIKACFSIEFSLQFANNQTVTVVVKDFKLVDGSNGMFVGSPTTPYEKDGERKYKKIVDINKVCQDAMIKVVSEAYDDSQELNTIYTEKSWKPDQEKNDPQIPF